MTAQVYSLMRVVLVCRGADEEVVRLVCWCGTAVVCRGILAMMVMRIRIGRMDFIILSPLNINSI
jgi:hypothetical protein